jgi:hypothetical protein
MQQWAARGARKRSVATGAILVCAALAASLPAGADELPEVGARPPQWSLHDRRDDPAGGYAVYRQELPGSEIPAYRLEAVIDAPPAVVAAAAARTAADPEAREANMEKTVLRDDGDTIVVYSYVHLPVVADRDVITRAELSRDPATGVHRMRWAVSDEGPPPKPGVVRLARSSGAWEFSPIDGGRTRVVYENHTDLGGSIPAWIIEPMMDDTVVQNFVRLRERVERERRMQSDAAPDVEPSS